MAALDIGVPQFDKKPINAAIAAGCKISFLGFGFAAGCGVFLQAIAPYLGLVFFSHQVGSFLGAWLGGLLYDAYQGYSMAWWIAATLVTTRERKKYDSYDRGRHVER